MTKNGNILDILEDGAKRAAKQGPFGTLILLCPKCGKYCAKIVEDVFDSEQAVILVCNICGFRHRYARTDFPPEHTNDDAFE